MNMKLRILSAVKAIGKILFICS